MHENSSEFKCFFSFYGASGHILANGIFVVLTSERIFQFHCGYGKSIHEYRQINGKTRVFFRIFELAHHRNAILEIELLMLCIEDAGWLPIHHLEGGTIACADAVFRFEHVECAMLELGIEA